MSGSSRIEQQLRKGPEVGEIAWLIRPFSFWRAVLPGFRRYGCAAPALCGLLPVSRSILRFPARTAAALSLFHISATPFFRSELARWLTVSIAGRLKLGFFAPRQPLRVVESFPRSRNVAAPPDARDENRLRG
ncbi:hypothetical protein ASPZODRAFT_19570 [Penicilliopsis zonata CBS 506.65]|uniref:Uncharacterized protein n=1 Tax=Penicilliopsis zonata CBS 506.65 TaxID=1073090 RepID=A0A1L9S8K6_9EURO|nr:hypothetical protein ASPZODRAFT_19570 [Penicilliopsis zonata CBS 506.65]OJJ43477.1 hypothetical protein ASPZODRAFT_19570 [Penicilliopsis zonata CBS 506.65]